MSDQLFRLWEKLQIELPEDAVPYFKPKHIALLQWFWQSRQLQSASEDPSFIQQCLKEQVERIASARVDIMVEAEQNGFELPPAEPTLEAFCNAVTWWGQQSEWGTWLSEVDGELKQFGYAAERPSPNYNVQDIELIQKWLFEQRKQHARVEKLERLATQLSFDCPTLDTPYREDQIEQLEQALNVRAELWSQFDIIEQSVREYDWDLKVAVEMRTKQHLSIVRQEVEQQIAWRLKMMDLNSKLSAVNSQPSEFSMPIKPEVVEAAQNRLIFHERCEEIINSNQKKWLLPWHRSKINVPHPPYDEDSFKQYQDDLAPYLLQSKLWLIAVMGGLVLLSGFILTI
ncbi:MAG: hypothetical protein ACON4U_17660 [Myxococcota bacterium]